MPKFDEGYGRSPFRALCTNYPDDATYPGKAFRVEWGPVFHRGRLDGSARVLVLGQDPAQHENISRRILVGEAGQRLQGFLAKMGMTTSYVMINTFLYSMLPTGATYKNDPGIIAYRNKWLDALLGAGTQVEAVVLLGALAEDAYTKWRTTSGSTIPYVKITHPTWPESSSNGDQAKYKAAIKTMLANWSGALTTLKPAIANTDVPGSFAAYGAAFVAGDLVEIPPEDLPAGCPSWMRALDKWATREGPSSAMKRRTIQVRVPNKAMP